MIYSVDARNPILKYWKLKLWLPESAVYYSIKLVVNSRLRSIRLWIIYIYISLKLWSRFNKYELRILVSRDSWKSYLKYWVTNITINFQSYGSLRMLSDLKIPFVHCRYTWYLEIVRTIWKFYWIFTRNPIKRKLKFEDISWDGRKRVSQHLTLKRWESQLHLKQAPNFS